MTMTNVGAFVVVLSLLVLVLLVLVTILLGVLTRAQRVAEAAETLYLATRWRSTTPRLSEHTEARLWETLRDALGLEPGTATALGVGDPRA